jgi:hypothetical protein
VEKSGMDSSGSGYRSVVALENMKIKLGIP